MQSPLHMHTPSTCMYTIIIHINSLGEQSHPLTDRRGQSSCMGCQDLPQCLDPSLAEDLSEGREGEGGREEGGGGRREEGGGRRREEGGGRRF